MVKERRVIHTHPLSKSVSTSPSLSLFSLSCASVRTYVILGIPVTVLFRQTGPILTLICCFPDPYLREQEDKSDVKKKEKKKKKKRNTRPKTELRWKAHTYVHAPPSKPHTQRYLSVSSFKRR